MSRAARRGERLAVALGGPDLVRAAGLAGIGSVLVSEPGEPARWSRHVASWVPDGDDVIERLRRAAPGWPSRPVLMPDRDRTLRFAVRHRATLEEICHVALPSADLLEAVTDKGRFQELATGLGLPVPPAHIVEPGAARRGPSVPPPVLVKPLVHDRAHDHRWYGIAGWQKALAVGDDAEWRQLSARLAEAGVAVLVQALVEGGEERIESYHAYVGRDGRTLGEFTGRKLRTRPARFGVSTALTTTSAGDVLALGRRVAAALALSGPFKVDFKRDGDGCLHLLEVNPRLSLWVHLGAVAGVNLPALMHADLTGGPVPPAARARAGVTWCDPRPDLAAARDAGMPLRRWLRWFASCDALSGAALDDPLPVLRGKVWPRLRRA